MIARDYSIMHCKDGNLYINFNNGTDFRSDDSKCLSNEDIGEIKNWIEQNNEYVRKDAFIEKVCDWLSDTLQTVVDVNIPSAHHVESIPALGIINLTKFIEKFKKEIMFLLD